MKFIEKLTTGAVCTVGVIASSLSGDVFAGCEFKNKDLSDILHDTSLFVTTEQELSMSQKVSLFKKIPGNLPAYPNQYPAKFKECLEYYDIKSLTTGRNYKMVSSSCDDSDNPYGVIIDENHEEIVAQINDSDLICHEKATIFSVELPEELKQSLNECMQYENDDFLCPKINAYQYYGDLPSELELVSAGLVDKILTMDFVISSGDAMKEIFGYMLSYPTGNANQDVILKMQSNLADVVNRYFPSYTYFSSSSYWAPSVNSINAIFTNKKEKLLLVVEIGDLDG